MMISEFTERTGFYPDQTLYEIIEAHYIDFNGDKDAFCKAYKENTDGLAEKIQYEANMARYNVERNHTAELTQLTKQLDKAREDLGDALTALDRELEWRPYNGCGTTMSQERYDELLKSCTGINGKPKVMSEEEAKKLVSDEFGFSPEKIEIVDTVYTYEVNRHHELRKDAEYKRQPLYDVSDYNYVRFNVRCAAATWYYEMVNGQLRNYCC